MEDANNWASLLESHIACLQSDHPSSVEQHSGEHVRSEGDKKKRVSLLSRVKSSISSASNSTSSSGGGGDAGSSYSSSANKSHEGQGQGQKGPSAQGLSWGGVQAVETPVINLLIIPTSGNDEATTESIKVEIAKTMMNASLAA